MNALKRMLLEREERKLWLAMKDADRKMRDLEFTRNFKRLRRELLSQGGEYNLMLYCELGRQFPGE